MGLSESDWYLSSAFRFGVALLESNQDGHPTRSPTVREAKNICLNTWNTRVVCWGLLVTIFSSFHLMVSPALSWWTFSERGIDDLSCTALFELLLSDLCLCIRYWGFDDGQGSSFSSTVRQRAGIRRRGDYHKFPLINCLSFIFGNIDVKCIWG